MPQPTVPHPPLRLTRRGRLVRSGLVLLLAVLLILGLVSILRALGSSPESATESADTGTTQTPSTSSDAGGSDAGGSDAGGEMPGEAAPEESTEPAGTTPEAETPEGPDGSGDDEMVRTDTVGNGSWEFAAPAPAPAEAEGTVRTYAVRVEGGLDLSADDVAQEVAQVLADERGWQDVDGVLFQRVGSSEEAEFTISLASPPMVDELCLPARTDGIWSCRIGPDVALNSDRWLHATPTYDDLAEYRAYMINHEVGHFLGHDHASCGEAGQPAPVMLQQSMDLEGCVPNAWPATDATG